MPQGIPQICTKLVREAYGCHTAQRDRQSFSGFLGPRGSHGSYKRTRCLDFALFPSEKLAACVVIAKIVRGGQTELL
jgi:hypothetical protein